MANRRPTFRPFRPPGKPEPLGSVLSAWLETSGLMRRSADEQVRDAWNTVVGPETAALTRLVGFRRGVLKIAVAGAALRQEFGGFRAKELLAAMNAMLKGVSVTKLQFKIGLPAE